MRPFGRSNLRAAVTPALVPVLALGLALAVATTGCGDRKLVARVDLQSFLDSTETEAHYGPVPPVALTDSVTVADSRAVNLVPGLQDLTLVESVTLDVAGEFRNLTGSGSGTVKLFLSDPGTDPFTTSPFVLPVSFAGSDTFRVATTIRDNPSLISLFNGDEMMLGIRLLVSNPPGAVDAIEGDFALTVLRAEVTSRQDVTH
ncbi:MAG: hypothetical protein ACREOU_08730 [Candidatus Eiseniibacteriota bacterium]